MIAPRSDGETGAVLRLGLEDGTSLVLTLEPQKAIYLADALQAIRPQMVEQALEKDSKR